MGRKGRKRKRVAKKDHKNLRLWAEGKREKVLVPHIEEYTNALERGWRDERDCLQKICNEFHAKIDWRLQDHEEPDVLPDYDPLAPVPAEDLGEAEKNNKRKRIELLTLAFTSHLLPNCGGRKY
ncbi:hypothetical protein B0H16DRAFT_1481453 [Mycena metata]|uniref:Uncharacterized protein n=1 Tax=Mycena metata TaxID=1033252 RepID=A0AAD7GY79_9AGAR|nr:hypothetical protein B0H16DRAFT_1481453 [Mycena metata]